MSKKEVDDFNAELNAELEDEEPVLPPRTIKEDKDQDDSDEEKLIVPQPKTK